jgi:hypothetical protein
MIYSLSDGPAALLLLVSSGTLLTLALNLDHSHQIVRATAYALATAAASITAVACIYAAFAINVDLGLATRGLFKATAGIMAFTSSLYGLKVIRLIRGK